MPEAGKFGALQPESMGIPALCLLLGRSLKPTSSPRGVSVISWGQWYLSLRVVPC